MKLLKDPRLHLSIVGVALLIVAQGFKAESDWAKEMASPQASLKRREAEKKAKLLEATKPLEVAK